jgi:small subunit ribosomal protein S9
MEHIIYYGIGRCKQAIAHIILRKGNGKILINNKPGYIYLQNNLTYLKKIYNTFLLLDKEIIYDIIIKTNGGGLTGQSNAILLGIARSLIKLNKNNRSILKKAGLLSRNARIKERKKYGLKKARKASQYSKR